MSISTLFPSLKSGQGSTATKTTGPESIKAVLFDMDGVLIDAREWHYEALNRALSLFGFTISRYDHLVTYDGLPTKKKLEMLSIERGLPTRLHAFINEMKQVYTIEFIHQLCHPTFVHEFALSSLKAQGYRLAVCSNSVRVTVDLMMEKSQLSPYLEFTLTNQDVTHAKPHPEIYTTAIRRMGLNPEECLIVEDNPHGIQAAKASGAHVLEVQSVSEVNLRNVTQKLRQIQGSLLHA